MTNPNLTAITPYGRAGGSSRVRVYDWLDRIHGARTASLGYIGASSAGARLLAKQPLKVVEAEIALRRIAREKRDHILLHREAGPFTRGGLEARILRSAAVGVYDFDDALQWDASRGMATWIFSKQSKCLAAVRTADRVVAGNEVLADWASNYAADVRVIPSCVEPSEYLVKDTYELQDPPRMVWLGSPSTEGYLTSISDALRAVHERTGARLTVISRGQGPLVGLEHLVDRVEWSPETYSAQLAASDIALAPLTNTRYATGKCAYKVLQYACAGLPTVVSPVGANRLAASRFGYSEAVSHNDWVDATESLVALPDAARRTIGQEARHAVQAHYSFETWTERWAAANGLDQRAL